MKAIGIGAGLLAFLAAALSAEAQVNIQGINPGLVEVDDSSALYQATISGTSGCYYQPSAYLGSTLKFDGTACYVSGTAPFTVGTSITGMNNWGMQVGQTLDFRGKAWTNPMQKKTHDLYRTVQAGGSTYLPSPDRRSTPSGLRGELYAAVLKNDEELLA